MQCNTLQFVHEEVLEVLVFFSETNKKESHTKSDQ